MSSTYPSDSSNSRTWWSLGSKQSTQDLRKPYSPDKSRSSGFNSIAVALGLKTKKRPILTIQDPQFQPSRTPLPTVDVKPSDNLPFKSASSTRLRVDSLGPRTPGDPPRESRQSLLTLSDVDPFAVRAVSSAPHTPSDPSRLSAYSNLSMADVTSKSTDPILNRASFASSSSLSTAHRSEPSPTLSLSAQAISDSGQRKLALKKSMNGLHRQQSVAAEDHSLETAWEALTLVNQSAVIKSGSSTTFPDKNRLSQPQPPTIPRPPMRARGMTDSLAGRRPDFLPREGVKLEGHSPTYITPNSSPRVIIRQPSVSRIGSPPSAPPRQELPPPPVVNSHQRAMDDDSELAPPQSTGSASSSSLSFASSVSSNGEPFITKTYSPRQKEKRSSDRPVASKAMIEGPHNIVSTPPQPLSSTRTLKKALSHQSLGKRSHPTAGPLPPPPPELPVTPKVPRKQRSFYQPKVSIPVSPPSRTNSSPGSTPVEVQLGPEQRISSASGISIPGRKRLFSGSNGRRPSTSQSTAPDDDTRSVFSVRSNPDQSGAVSLHKFIGQPQSPSVTSSFWVETGHDHAPVSPQLITHEYTPQQIMSPAEMAKLEASVEESRTFGRQRGLSILSTSTTMSLSLDEEAKSVLGVGPLPDNMKPLDGATTARLLARSNSLVPKSLTLPPRLAIRPSTSQVSMTTSTTDFSSPRSTPTSPSITSLPPPPRRSRPRPAFVYEEPSIAPLGRKYVRSQVSVEKALQRRSLMRKPSFLEIDDDTDDQGTDIESQDEPPSGSFLNLTRESFDTTRSISE